MTARARWGIALSLAALGAGCNPSQDFQTYCNETGRCPDSGVADGGCLGLNAACAGATACCSGNCLGGVCAPAGACFDGGETCANQTDCCSGLNCQGVCVTAGNEHLAFVSPSGVTAHAGDCATVAVELVNSAGAPIQAATDITLQFSSSSGSLTFSTDACTSSVGTGTLSKGQTGAVFEFRDTLVELPMIAVASQGFPTISQVETILPGAASKLTFRDHPLASIQAGACAGPEVILVEDAYGNGTDAGAAIPFSLSAMSGLLSFYQATCGTAGPFAVPGGASAATFELRGSDAGAAPLSVTLDAGSAFTGDTTTVSVLGVGSPYLAFLPATPVSVLAGDCPSLTIGSFDAGGAPLQQPSNLTLALTSVSGVTYFPSPNCTGAGSIVIPAGSSTEVFSLRAQRPVPGVQLIAAATGPVGYYSATVTLYVDAGAPASMTVQPASQDFAPGTCGANTFTLYDGQGNLATFATAPAFSCTFSALSVADTTCTALPSPTFPAFQSTTSFDFTGTTVGTYTGTCTAGGVTSTSFTEIVDAGSTSDAGCLGQGAPGCGTTACCAGLQCPANVCCGAPGYACSSPTDCCSNGCDGGCCNPDTAFCAANSDCCSRACDGGACCEADGTSCNTATDCCAGTCLTSGHCGACIAAGSSTCGAPTDCCNAGLCDAGSCCYPNILPCFTNVQCCSGYCAGGTGHPPHTGTCEPAPPDGGSGDGGASDAGCAQQGQSCGPPTCCGSMAFCTGATCMCSGTVTICGANPACCGNCVAGVCM